MKYSRALAQHGFAKSFDAFDAKVCHEQVLRSEYSPLVFSCFELSTSRDVFLFTVQGVDYRILTASLVPVDPWHSFSEGMTLEKNKYLHWKKNYLHWKNF